MVLLGRIELPTSALPRMRSTTELQQHTISVCRAVPDMPAAGRGALWRRGPALSSAALQQTGRRGKAGAMNDANPEAENSRLTREERLAARLRDNLRRRKAQARALDGKADSASAPRQEG